MQNYRHISRSLSLIVKLRVMLYKEAQTDKLINMIKDVKHLHWE
jgi:hypothetical protein